MRSTQGWTERDEDGVKWDIEAHKERNVWKLKRRSHRREPWEQIENPSRAQREALLDLLKRKYQRRGCAWRDVELAEHFLEEAPPET